MNQPPEHDIDNLVEIITGRRSVRAFRTEPVDRAIVVRAIEAAGWAPSPHGRQPWRFVVIESAGQRLALADAMAGTWRQQLQFDGQEREVVQTRLEKSRQRLITAPVLIIACLTPGVIDRYPDPDRQTAELTMAVQSIGSAIQNLLLTLYANGVDAGWMCAPLFCPAIVRDFCGLDESYEPHALLPVGYAAKDPARRPRIPVDELIVKWM